MFNEDGSIKVAGIMPSVQVLRDQSRDARIPYGCDFYTADGSPSNFSDPAGTDLLTWQKELVDFYGEDNLAEFVAGQASEWGPTRTS